MRASVTLSADGVTKYFGSRTHRHAAVSEVDLTVTDVSRVGLVGESGSGKSTLGRMLVGLEQPSEGAVHLDGQPLETLLRFRGQRAEVRRTVQYVAQDTTSSFDPRRTLLESVMQPLRHLLGLPRARARTRALETIESLGLAPVLAERYPRYVSGGQRQRFAIARALVVEPKILVCDEVVSALDVSVQGAILNLLKRACVERGAGLVFVSHGLPATGFVCDELAVMHRGRIVERGASSQVLRAPAHEYTRDLVRAHEARRPVGVGAAVLP